MKPHLWDGMILAELAELAGVPCGNQTWQWAIAYKLGAFPIRPLFHGGFPTSGNHTLGKKKITEIIFWDLNLVACYALYYRVREKVQDIS